MRKINNSHEIYIVILLLYVFQYTNLYREKAYINNDNIYKWLFISGIEMFYIESYATNRDGCGV